MAGQFSGNRTDDYSDMVDKVAGTILDQNDGQQMTPAVARSIKKQINEATEAGLVSRHPNSHLVLVGSSNPVSMSMALNGMMGVMRRWGTVTNMQSATDMLRGLDVPKGSVWDQAIMDIAAKADHPAMENNEYHNASHMIEVTMAAVNMAVAHQDIFADDSVMNKVFQDYPPSFLMLCAQGHDIEYDSAQKVDGAFGREKISADAIEESMRAAGLNDPELIADMRAVIYATDPNAGYQVLDEVMRQEQETGQFDPSTVDPQSDVAGHLKARPELSRLANPSLSEISKIMRDADLYTSLADPQMSEKNTQDLHLETGGAVPTGADGFAGFHKFVARGGFISKIGQTIQSLSDELVASNQYRVDMDQKSMPLGDAHQKRLGASGAKVQPTRFK